MACKGDMPTLVWASLYVDHLMCCKLTATRRSERDCGGVEHARGSRFQAQRIKQEDAILDEVIDGATITTFQPGRFYIGLRHLLRIETALKGNAARFWRPTEDHIP